MVVEYDDVLLPGCLFLFTVSLHSCSFTQMRARRKKKEARGASSKFPFEFSLLSFDLTLSQQEQVDREHSEEKEDVKCQLGK